jgi:hypothetical protein
MRRSFSLFTILFLILTIIPVEARQPEPKPRVIVMNDGEIDDRSSMVRFLLYTNNVECLAIIQTNSVYQRSGWSSDKWIEEQIDAYEKVHPNLVIHDPSYPTADYLRSILLVGDEDEAHLLPGGWDSWNRFPGMEPLIDPSNWPDTPGSDRIVEILLEDDPGPVHIQAWGGGNTALRAFDKLKAEHPDDYERAVSKAVMYHIWYQDWAGNYIERHHPGVTMVLSYFFSGTWDYGSQRYTYQFINDYVRNNHGPLGALYPQDYISEGDSPAFLYSIANGLRSQENPTYGGWGGRFYNVFGNVYRDVSKGSYRKWVEYANRDFHARMQWCVAERFEDANHHPVVEIAGGLDRAVKSGEEVVLEAKVSDPDDDREFDQLRGLLWWHYQEAGTFKEMVETSNPRSTKVSFIAPKVNQPETIHMIFQATDRGTPPLTTFQRVIITVVP